MCDESHTWYRFIFALNRDEKFVKMKIPKSYKSVMSKN